MRTAWLLILLTVIALANAAYGAGKAYPDRWFYVSRSLQSDADEAAVEKLVATASEHGLTGMLLAGGYDTRRPPDYFARLKKLRAFCEERHIEIIPILFSAGYGGEVLSHNPNLAEGLPVVDAPFQVHDGQARLVPDPTVTIPNGSFEEWEGNRPKGLTMVDKPGEIAFADHEVAREGKTSLRIEHVGARNPEYGHGRIMQEVTVTPHRRYRISLWARTRDLQPASSLALQVYAGETQLAWSEPRMRATSDWRQLSVTVNSGARDRLRIYAGLWGGKSGTLWLDGFAIEEVGLNDVLRRPGTPLTVRSEDGSTTYEEGKDFAPVRDPELLDRRADTTGPSLRLLPGSRLHEGDRLRVSFYHAVVISEGQVSICMSEPETHTIWREQAALVEKALSPRKWFLSMDEIRAGGSCQACKQRGLTMGEILGDCITQQMRIIRDLHPGAEVYAWSDMLDPNHNAHGNYYQVDGDFTGSWEHVPKDLIICCWYYEVRDKSLKFFSDRGFRTLAGAYYDADTLDNPRGWLESLDRTPNAQGIMYTSWRNKYDLLAGFGDLVKR